MSYYITAHKYNSKINIPVEEKHKYDTDSIVPQDGINATEYQGYSHFGTAVQTNLLNLRKLIIDSYVDATGHSKDLHQQGQEVSYRYSLALKNPQLFYVPRLFSVPQGTGPDQRIGEKIFMKTVKIMLDVKLHSNFFKTLAGNVPVNNNVNTFEPESFSYTYTGAQGSGTGTGLLESTQFTNKITTYQNNRLNYSQWAKFRIVIIRFDDFDWPDQEPYTALEKYFSELFNGVHVPNFIVPTVNANQYDPLYAVSNQSKMLRESTTYTGRYQILYDDVFTLGDKDPQKHIEINLSPKMNLTFNDKGNITNEKWNNVYGFILPPTLYTTDIDPITLTELMKLNVSESSDVTIADFIKNIKYTYYDL